MSTLFNGNDGRQFNSLEISPEAKKNVLLSIDSKLPSIDIINNIILLPVEEDPYSIHVILPNVTATYYY